MSQPTPGQGKWKIMGAHHPTMKELTEYEDKHTLIKVNRGRVRMGGNRMVIHVSHNGRQWTQVSFLPHKASLLIEKMLRKVDTLQLEHIQGLVDQEMVQRFANEDLKRRIK